MPPGGKQYWIRTEQGRVWGPYPIDALERLRGQLTEKAQASLDGKEFRSGMDFPELRSLLTARRASVPAPASTPPPPKERLTPASGMYVGPALRAMLEGTAARKHVEEPAAAPAPEKPLPPPPPRPTGPPVMRPAAVMQSHKLLGEHALFLLDRAIETSRATFSFQKDAPSPPGAFALGHKWTLLAEAVRRLDPAPLRARLGKQLTRVVQRSGGSSIGKLEELALTAQEARLYASVDGTRRGDELIEQHGSPMAVRLLYLLTELKHLSFSVADVEQPRPAAAAVAPSPVVPPP